MRRSSSIELYRCSLMLGICLLHSVGLSAPLCKPVQSALLPCVVGFVFVTGWFGVRLKLSKIFRLVGTAFLCSLVVRLVDIVAFEGNGYDRMGGFNFLSWSKQWWFLNSYLMLMVVAPVLDCAVDCLRSDIIRVRNAAIVACVGILLCTFVFGFASYHFGVTILPQNIVGFFSEPCSFGTFSGIYVVARIIRTCRLSERCTKPLIVFYLCCGMLGVMSGLRWHNSPFSLMVAAAFFFLMKDVSLPSRLAKSIELVAPSMFAVYLLHSHKSIGFVIINRYEEYLCSIGIPLPFVWGISAITIFVTTLLLDAPRRMLIFLLKRPISFAIELCDGVENDLLSRMARFLGLNTSREAKKHDA